jgi:hypothetical protein
MSQYDAAICTKGRTGIAYENDLEEHFLVHLHELLVPLLDVGRLLPGIGIVILCLRRIIAVMFAPLDDFPEDGLVHRAAGHEHFFKHNTIHQNSRWEWE